MRSIIKELVFSFTGGVLGMSVWYYLGIHVFPDLYTIELSYINVLTHYAIPIQAIGTLFFYIELWVFKTLRIK